MRNRLAAHLDCSPKNVLFSRRWFGLNSREPLDDNTIPLAGFKERAGRDA